MRRVLLLLVIAGCSSVDTPFTEEGNPTPASSPTPAPIWSLSNGDYSFDGEDVTSDTCWQQPSVHSLLTGIALPFTLTTNGQTSFTVVGYGITEGVIPPLEGLRGANELGGAGSVTNAFSTACSIRYDGLLIGVMTSNDAFNATVTLDLVVAGVMNQAGTEPSNCSEFVNEDFPGTAIPVPPPIYASSECSVTVEGRVYKGPPE